MSGKNSNVLAARVVSCTFKREAFIDSISKTIYYHDLELDTGETVEIGVIEKEPEKISAGAMIRFTYKDEEKTIIKLEKTNPFSNSPNGKSSQQTGTSKPSGSSKSTGSSQSKSDVKTKPAPKTSGMRKEEAHNAYMGYAMAYAKDLVIAGKTSDKDVKDLLRIGATIYNEFGEWLMNGTVRFVDLSRHLEEQPVKTPRKTSRKS